MPESVQQQQTHWPVQFKHLRHLKQIGCFVIFSSNKALHAVNRLTDVQLNRAENVQLYVVIP